MRSLSKIFENRTIVNEKLLKYGFVKKDNCYFYENNIYNNQFKVVIELSKEKQTSKLIDLLNNEEYFLVDVHDYSGDFIGSVKEEYETILNDIVEKCSIPNIFKSKQSKEVIKYIKEKYDDDLEYLWEKFPNNAIWRNNNNKWYGILLTISKSKLGIDSDEIVDIIDLRYQKDNITKIIDNKKIFGGYHMNKNNWITIKLDGSVDINEIYKLIDNSFKLSLNR